MVYGIPDEWQRLEAPLLKIDPVLEWFAQRYGAALSKNDKGYPERSLSWGGNPNFLIQVYMECEAGPSWNLWRCCLENRQGSHFWRNDFAVRDEQLECFQERLPTLLTDSFERLQMWGIDRDKLELAMSLAPVPRHDPLWVESER